MGDGNVTASTHPAVDLVIRGRRVITPRGTRACALHVAAGRIVRVSAWDDLPAGVPVSDAGRHVVMPGLVDTHVHVNEPGREEWEGFSTATRAAAAGGITTILDMPLNSTPATTTVAALEAKREAARGKCTVNVEFIGGVVPGNTGELEGLRDAGVRAFKCFLSPSGVDDFEHVNEQDLRAAFPVLAQLGLPLMVHAEDPACLLAHGSASRSYADYLGSRPVAAEHSAIAMLIRLMQWCPTSVHVVHLSSATSLDMICSARERGLPITVETCPHYLTFAAEDVPDGATEYKCAPPIRDAAERDALWRGLIEGHIDMIVTDHSPCPPDMKQTDGDFFGAWGGIASLQVSLAAVWAGARTRGVGPERVARWMSSAPARLVNLDGRKGALAAGYDADVVVWDPDASLVVDPAVLLHRHNVTPYAGMQLQGMVVATYVGGRIVFDGEAGRH